MKQLNSSRLEFGNSVSHSRQGREGGWEYLAGAVAGEGLGGGGSPPNRRRQRGESAGERLCFTSQVLVHTTQRDQQL
jgi:hypothetical protein